MEVAVARHVEDNDRLVFGEAGGRRKSRADRENLGVVVERVAHVERDRAEPRVRAAITPTLVGVDVPRRAIAEGTQQRLRCATADAVALARRRDLEPGDRRIRRGAAGPALLEIRGVSEGGDGGASRL